jgi:hypothetical protein
MPLRYSYVVVKPADPTNRAFQRFAARRLAARYQRMGIQDKLI